MAIESSVFPSICSLFVSFLFFFFKQKTAYEMRISDWSSDVCSSDLSARVRWPSFPSRPSSSRSASKPVFRKRRPHAAAMIALPRADVQIPLRLWHNDGVMPGPRRSLKPLDAAALDRLALRYVERFATTRAKLAAYLARKIRERGWAGARVEPAEVASRMAALGYVDDRAFAEARADRKSTRLNSSH